jgi:hypothetical protein
MHDLPAGNDLLTTARDSLLNELLPHLPAAQKYTALMIANAIAIAGREQTNAAHTLEARRRLQRQVPGCSDIISSDIGSRDQQFCVDLRNGVLDAELLALLPALRADVLSRLQVGNPKYLQQITAATMGETACAN